MEREGFAINSYDKFVANKIISSKQWSVIWYTNDDTEFHVEMEVVSGVELMKKYVVKLTMTRGKKLPFLGIYITIVDGKNVEIEMND